MTSGETARLADLPVDEVRGTGGMILFITTEAALFVMFFFSYLYLGRGPSAWPPHPPKLTLALVLLAVLLASSVVVHLGERALKRGSRTGARALLAVAVAMGIAFLVLQAFEYREELKLVRPSDGAYGSIFYTLTGFHAAHVVAGVLMLAFAALVPGIGGVRPPHRALHNAALYWHFVDAVWVAIVAVLYVLPNVTG